MGGSFVFKDGFVGVAYSSFDSTYYIPGIEAAASKNHIVLDQSKFSSRGEWRVNGFGLEAVRFWFGATDYKHNEIGLADPLDPTTDGVRQTFTNKEQEGRVEVGQEQAGAHVGEAEGNTAAKGAAGTGDQGDAPIESEEIGDRAVFCHAHP